MKSTEQYFPVVLCIMLLYHIETVETANTIWLEGLV